MVRPTFETFMANPQLAAQHATDAPEPAAAASQPSAAEPAPAPSPTPAAEPAQPAKPAAEAPPPFSTAAARHYCVNIADAAAEAKFAWQKKKLEELAADIDKRVGLLNEKIAEYQKWVTRRDEFLKRARDNLVLIYSRMKPDAAALQLVAMEEETAAAVLLKLDPRVAGTILNEMDPAKAARLTATINGSAKDPPGPPPKSAAEAGKS
jgi:flagellar motility protein MotE (MotC chaperone)